ncbi:hypothetical protein CRENBAI_021979 [Crenichthys baileyi]|uniref:Uncharacterized protein n=1 Tax=Crenichthys baileyi TaxID=28760 RepID=A0AAV9SA55_9TELE
MLKHSHTTFHCFPEDKQQEVVFSRCRVLQKSGVVGLVSEAFGVMLSETLRRDILHILHLCMFVCACMLTHTAHSLLLFDSDGHIRQPVPWQPQGLNSSVKSLGAHTQTHILPPPPLHTHMQPSFASNCWIPLQHTNRLEENTQRRRKRSEKKREVKCSEI